MTHGHALWQRVFKDIAPEYPGIEATHYYVDALAMYMVLDPGQFQVIVTNNLFGDIVTDLGAALQGGLGMAASGNIHPGRTSMFEPVHGSAPKLAGKNVANPDRRHPLGRADARDVWVEGGSRCDRGRRCRGGASWPWHDRHRRDARHDSGRGCNRAAGSRVAHQLSASQLSAISYQLSAFGMS